MRLRTHTLFELALIPIMAYYVYYTYTRQISIDSNLIPTVINGLVTSISLIIGFTAAIFTFTLSRQAERVRFNRRQEWKIALLLFVPIALLVTLYDTLLSGDTVLALRFAMANLGIALAILADVLTYLGRQDV